MLKFLIDKKHQEIIDSILCQFEYDLGFIKNKVGKYCDQNQIHSDLVESYICFPGSAPLLQDDRFLPNVTRSTILFADAIRELINKLARDDILEEDRSTDDGDLFCFSLRYDDILHIVNGTYVLQLFGENVFSLEMYFPLFNVEDPLDMLYIIGAELANKIAYQDPREVEVTYPDKALCYRFGNDIHGDFRFSQFDLSEKEVVNPLKNTERLPFGMPKEIGLLSGYHSVESSFLAGLLGYAHLCKIHLPILGELQQFIESLAVKGIVFGSFADAGMRSGLTAGFYFGGLEYGLLSNIHREGGQSYYQPVIEDQSLTYYGIADPRSDTRIKILSIEAIMVEDLIRALFKKVAAGNGRASFDELIDILLYYQDTYQ